MIQRVRKSLTLKWMFFSIFLATIPLAIAGFSIIRIYQKDLKESVMKIEVEKANSIVERTESLIRKITESLLFLSKGEYLREDNLVHTEQHLEALLYLNDYHVELTLSDKKGRELIKVSKRKGTGPSDLESHSKNEVFKAASKGQIYYGDPFSASDDLPTMVVAVPIQEYKDEPVGVLAITTHIHLWNLIPKTPIGKRGIAYVVNREGTLIAHSDMNRVLSRTNVRSLPMVNQVLGGKEGSIEFEHPKGERYLGVYKPIKKLGWGVIVQIPVEEVYEPIWHCAHTAIKWILIALSAAILFSLLLTKRLTHPIKRLSAHMVKVSQGDLDVPIQQTTQDEIGSLTRSFNRMIRDLKQSQEALREAEAKYRTIFENSKDMVFITTVEGRFIEVNQAGIEMLGYSDKNELMGMNVSDACLHPGLFEIFQKEISREGYIKDFETKLRKKDGTTMDCLITATLRRDAKGHAIGHEGIIKDISDRKKVEEELLQRTKELQTLYHLGDLINRSLDLDEILTVALNHLIELIDFEMGRIVILEEDGKTLETRIQRGYPPSLLEKAGQFDIGEGLAGIVLQEKHPLAMGIDDHPFPRNKALLREEGIQSVVSIPLIAKDRAIGAINMASRALRIFTQKEIDLLESIGNQIGLALENAELFSNVAKAKSEWETTFDAVTDLITITGKDYRILRANSAAFKRFALKPEEMIGKRCFEALCHRNERCERCHLAKTLITKKHASGERESEYLNGLFQYHTFPVFDEAGEIVAVVDLSREITDQKRMEVEKEVVNNINKILASSLDVRQVMQAVHFELKKVLNTERMTITLLLEKGQWYRFFSLKEDFEVKEMIGPLTYPVEGTPIEKVLETGLPAIISNSAEIDSWFFQRLLKEGIRSSLVFPMEYRGKIIGTINLSSREPNHFSENQFNFLDQISTGLAISIENSLLLDGIKQSEEKYRTVVESALDGALIVGEDYRFKYVNERLAEILGYSQEELIGTDFRNYLDEASKQLVSDQYVRRQKGEEAAARYEFNVIRKGSEVRSVEMSSNIMKDSQGYANTIAFIKDITEKKKMEEQMIQTEKLRALGEMANGVAHDFNNALAAILGNTQLLLYTAKGEEVKESLKVIEKVAWNSVQSVRRLQEFTRSRIHQTLFKLDINFIVQNAIEITRPKWKDDIQSKGIQIEIAADLHEVPLVLGNTSEMTEVIASMIFNATEAMPEGGKIHIRTFGKNHKVYIQISDTGIGMTEEVRTKVFEPFFTTRPFSNTGLGLSMSYGIIKRLGGEIEVESQSMKGTTFTIILPVEAERKEERIAPPAIRQGTGARVLVIDDEETVRDVLSKILYQINYRVIAAENGEEGIRLFKEGEFDMVLTDLGMPGMSGWDVCKTIKEMSPHTPVGMITGWGVEMDQVKIEENGIDFIIPKPFQFDQILRVLAETMPSKS